MPPKNASKGGASQSKKADQKKKEKIIEDKTFGLKNKKGAKQQKFIQQVQNQVKHGGNKSSRLVEKEKEDQKLKKEEKKKEINEITALFKPVQQLAGKGSDPKSVLCAFFKQGSCSKGSKCKFSHDMAVERKGEKRSAYIDMRDDSKETSEDWDEEKLKDVVEMKHGKENRKPSTDIVCKFFLDAVEIGKYGWFWECPNGEKCIYRHALPPGYVLKKDRKKMDKQKEEISLEELIEKERAALGHNTTRVTLETFLAWKKKKLREKKEAAEKETDKKRNDLKQGRALGISGREMFTFNPEMAAGEDEMEDGDDAFDINNMEEEEGDEDEMRFEFKEIDFSNLMSEYEEVQEDPSMSIANPDRLKMLREEIKLGEEETKENGAVGGEGESAAVDIDEDLFDGADEDLDELEEQLDDMTVT
ncbi:zinc finger CCCH domain-containing protein 15 homolog [Oratosquilla oratoria]|uniref:zinc finger CCCH domain-containing protein 15 homolog n=1 Tax=Oratosquilla oratoria TaxID=337810 RepID=UPI003F766D76